MALSRMCAGSTVVLFLICDSRSCSSCGVDVFESGMELSGSESNAKRARGMGHEAWESQRQGRASVLSCLMPHASCLLRDPDVFRKLLQLRFRGAGVGFAGELHADAEDHSFVGRAALDEGG